MVLDIWSWLLNPAAVLSYGYMGIFGLSLIMSLLVFVPMPYFIPIVVASIIFDPSAVALFSAAGATLAKTTIFRAAYLGRRFVGEETQRRLRPFKKLVARYGWIAAFFAAVTPVPDDVIYIPLGFAKYSLWRFVVATFIGKLIFTLFITWGARFAIGYVQLFIEGVTDPTIAVIAAVFFGAMAALVVYAILKLEWERILGRWFPWTVGE